MFLNMRTLLTGGLGLIGSSLANRLTEEVVIVSRSKNHEERLTNKSAKILLKDLLSLEKKDIAGFDTIYHFASTVDNYHVLTNPYIDMETNIKGIIHLLELLKDLPKKPKIIFPSTFFVYGNEYDRTKKPINEESKTEPLALYPATKLCAESIIKLYSRLYCIPYIITRFTNVFSEHEDYDNKKKGVLNYMIMQALKGETLNVYKGGNFFRDYIYLEDVLDAIQFLEKKVTNDLFLVGYGESTWFKDLIEHIHNLAGNKSKIAEIETPFFHSVVGIGNFEADTSKINKLGWKAKVDYKEGIRRVIEKYKQLI